MENFSASVPGRQPLWPSSAPRPWQRRILVDGPLSSSHESVHTATAMPTVSLWLSWISSRMHGEVSVTSEVRVSIRDCGWDTSGSATVWTVGKQPKIQVSWDGTLFSWRFIDVSKESWVLKTSVTIYQSTRGTRPFWCLWRKPVVSGPHKLSGCFRNSYLLFWLC